MEIKHSRKVGCDDDRERIHRERFSLLQKSFVMPLQQAQERAAPMMDFDITGIPFNRSLKVLLGTGPIPFEVALHHTEGRVRFGQHGIELQRLRRGRSALRIRISRRERIVVAEYVVAVRQTCIALRVSRVAIDRLLKMRDSFLHALLASLVPMITPHQVVLVRFRIHLPRAFQGLALLRRNGDPDFVCDALRDLALQR